MSVVSRYRLTMAMVIGTVVIAVVIPAASARPTPYSVRVTAAAGSGRYLVYTAFDYSGTRQASTGQLWALDLRGDRTELGTVSKATTFSLSRTTLLSRDEDTGVATMWDLPEGQPRQVTATTGYYPVVAAPHGFLEMGQQRLPGSGYPLKRVGAAGDVTNLGVPFASHRGYTLAVGSSSVVAYQSDVEQPGGIRSMRFMKPHKRNTLLSPRRDAGEAFCAVPQGRYVACTLPEQRRIVLNPITGGEPVEAVTAAIGFNPPTSINKSLVWLWRGHLNQQIPGGQTDVSRRTFAPHRLLRALGQVIVSNRSRTVLLGLSTATSRPRVLVTVS